MSALWSISRALQIPLDEKITELHEVPYTISFVIRKRIQIDNMYELPKEKRPPEKMLYDGSGKELEEWLDKVLSPGKKKMDVAEFIISDSEIEG